MQEREPIVGQPQGTSFSAYVLGDATERVIKRSSPMRSLNILALCIAFIVPSLVFGLSLALMTFSVHYEKALLSWVCLILILVFVLILGFLGERGSWTFYGGNQSGHTWHRFAFGTCLLGWSLAFFFGYVNFSYNFLTYHEYSNKGLYPDVSPKTDNSIYLDAGIIMFVSDAYVDVDKFASYTSGGELYCAAPIGEGDASLSSYGFWAIGTNCCSTSFACGDGANAKGGLRLIKRAAEASFKVAVETSASEHDITVSDDPIYLFWMTNPVEHVHEYWVNGFSNYNMMLFGFLTLQLFLAVAFAVFSWRRAKR